MELISSKSSTKDSTTLYARTHAHAHTKWLQLKFYFLFIQFGEDITFQLCIHFEHFAHRECKRPKHTQNGTEKLVSKLTNSMEQRPS